MWSFDIFKQWGFPEQDKFNKGIGYTQAGGAGDISGEAGMFDQYGKQVTSGIIQQKRQKKGHKKGVMETVNMVPNSYNAPRGQIRPNAPDAIKFSPTLRFLYASGKNVGEFLTKERGTYTAGRDREGYEGGDNESQMMRDLAPHAPYIVSGTTKPTNSPAANWFASSLGNTSLSGSNFSMATEYAAAKAKQQSILGSPSPVGQMAVNDSPFYNWLKDRSLNKGIL